MDVLSLIALLAVILLSALVRRNTGIMGLAFAFVLILIGHLNVSKVLAGFPSSLFLILVGTSYLFSIANQNGTLGLISTKLLHMVRGRAVLLPFIFGLLGWLLSAIGAGSMAMVAMLMPPAMVIAEREKINPLIMILIVNLLSMAGDYSPIAVYGAMINGVFAEYGITGLGMRIFLSALVVYLSVSIVTFIVLGGLKMMRSSASNSFASQAGAEEKFNRNHALTLIGIFIFVIAIVCGGYHTGFTALAVGVVLTLIGCGDESKIIPSLPWNAIMLISGVSLLVVVVRMLGGVDLAVRLVSSIASAKTLSPIVTFVGTVTASFTSTMSVVFPSYVPLFNPLIKAVGSGVNVEALYVTFAVTVSLGDTSPLSTNGALCLATATPSMDKEKLFREQIAFAAVMWTAGVLFSYTLLYVLHIFG